MAKAYINGLEVTVYDFDGDFCKCYVPEVGITQWYHMNLIALKLDETE